MKESVEYGLYTILALSFLFNANFENVIEMFFYFYVPSNEVRLFTRYFIF